MIYEQAVTPSFLQLLQYSSHITIRSLKKINLKYAATRCSGGFEGGKYHFGVALKRENIHHTIGGLNN